MDTKIQLADGVSFEDVVEVVYHNNKYGEYISIKLTVFDEVFYLSARDVDKKLLLHFVKSILVSKVALGENKKD